MTRYQLAKLIQWAGTLRTRKRLQKVAYLLQAAGCPFDDEFGLHLFGPYSADVADRVDEMAQVGLLTEERQENYAGSQYNYTLTPAAQSQLASVDATDEGQALAAEIALYEDQARDLLDRDPRELEVAATIVFFRQQGNDWPEAVQRTCDFKRLRPHDGLVQRAEALARTILP
jgi:uncharacterized protein YwgA